jgi:hypothetical protein
MEDAWRPGFSPREASASLPGETQKTRATEPFGHGRELELRIGRDGAVHIDSPSVLGDLANPWQTKSETAEWAARGVEVK